MRLLYILFIAVITSATAFAQNDGAHFVIEKHSNSTQTVNFSELQNITFYGNNVSILLKNGNVISNSMDDIKQIKSYAGSTGIEENSNFGKELVSYVSPDQIMVNCSACTTITIYSISGRHISTTLSDADNGIISIAALPKGIYLLRANEKTAKIIKR